MRAPGARLAARLSPEVRAGAGAMIPMLFGAVPFGLVVGATPPADGLGGGAAIGLSTIVFAGASQLAVADVLAEGGAALVAVLAACTINLRLLLYSASIAPYLAHEPLRRRLLVGYLLTDQAYAMSIGRWTQEREPCPARRLAFFLGAAIPMWAAWQVATVAGIYLGAVLPEELPLDFAAPLVFVVLLVPTVTSLPAVAAAVVGGAAAVITAELAAANLAVVVGAFSGIAAGVVTELLAPRSVVPSVPAPSRPDDGIDV